MNKLILLIILLLTVNCKSQTNIIDAADVCNYNSINLNDGGLYLKDISNIIMPYLGVWKWTSGNKEMTLTLIKQTKYHYTSGTDNYYADRLVGYYTYKENGLTIIDTSGDNLMDDYGLKVEFDIECGGGVVASFFKDVKKEKSFIVVLKKLSTTQMKFTGKVGEGTYQIGRTPTTVYLGSTFPLEMVFTKQ